MALTDGSYSGMPSQQVAYALAPQVKYEQAADAPQVVYEQLQTQYAQAPQIAYEYAAPQQVAHEYAAPQQATYAQASTIQHETFAEPAYAQAPQVMYETFAVCQAQVMHTEPQVAYQTTAASSYVEQGMCDATAAKSRGCVGFPATGQITSWDTTWGWITSRSVSRSYLPCRGEAATAPQLVFFSAEELLTTEVRVGDEVNFTCVKLNPSRTGNAFDVAPSWWHTTREPLPFIPNAALQRVSRARAAQQRALGDHRRAGHDHSNKRRAARHLFKAEGHPAPTVRSLMPDAPSMDWRLLRPSRYS